MLVGRRAVELALKLFKMEQKLIIQRSFSVICVMIALYYVSNQIIIFCENKDVSHFSFKQYHSTSTDKYPTHTICLSPGADELETLYQTDKISETLGMTEVNYIGMLSGSTQGRTNFSVLEFDDAKWDLKLILESYGAYSLQTGLKTLHYWDTEIADIGSISSSPFHTGYQNPGKLCITRNEQFYPHQTISYEQIGMNVKNWLGDLQVYIHYPGQLMTVIDSDPKFSINLSNISNTVHYPTFEISQLQVLRRRFDGRQHCNDDNNTNVDTRWRESVMRKIGCVPSYWKNLTTSDEFGLNYKDDCSHSFHYESLYNQIIDADAGKVLYEPSCNQSTIIGTMLSNQQREDTNVSYILLEINHSSEYYIEVMNVRAKSFEDLCSQIGGVIGICLGVSLLQIPDFLFKLTPSTKNMCNKSN